MVGTVKTKPVRTVGKGQRAVVLPGSSGAEPWEVWILGGKSPPLLAQAASTPTDHKLTRDATLALPVSQVYCVPLWLNETDTKQFAGMIPLQLELRGLVPRNEPPVFDWSVVVQEEARTLVLVAVLPASLPAELQAEAFQAFDFCARFYPMSADTAVLWREQDHLAFAITRGTHLVYFQSVSESEVTPRVLQDLSCAKMTLAMQDILPTLQCVEVWSHFSDSELSSIANTMGVAVVEKERPAPVIPAQGWKLTPAVLSEARRKRESSRWIRRALVGVLVLYVAATVWLVTRLALTQAKVTELQKWQQTHEHALDLVHQGRATWKVLSPVVDTANYPLELLLHVQQSLNPDQLHLTIFETGEDHLLIKGEAKNVAAAIQFYDKLKADPSLKAYTLQMDNPRPLPNDLAQFQIQGTRASTN